LITSGAAIAAACQGEPREHGEDDAEPLAPNHAREEAPRGRPLGLRAHLDKYPKLSNVETGAARSSIDKRKEERCGT
jgi:hypothetical protein